MICTIKGRVVYDRIPHLFNWGDAQRIISKLGDRPMNVAEVIHFLLSLNLSLGQSQLSRLEDASEDIWFEPVETIREFADQFFDALARTRSLFRTMRYVYERSELQFFSAEPKFLGIIPITPAPAPTMPNFGNRLRQQCTSMIAECEDIISSMEA